MCSTTKYPKQMLMLVVNDEDKDDAIYVILHVARTGENGHYGDGRIFVSSVSEAWTISTGAAGCRRPPCRRLSPLCGPIWSAPQNWPDQGGLPLIQLCQVPWPGEERHG